MSRFLLFLMLAIFGIFVYLMCFQNTIVYPLLIPVILIVIVWYVVTFLVTRKMVEKQRGGENLMYLKGQMIDKIKNDVCYGALVVTPSEMVFYKRKSWKGGVAVIWSTSIPELESYELERVDGKHKGIKLSIKGDTHPIFISSNDIEKREQEFRSMIGWQDGTITNITEN